ncbi:hypothetical protein E4T52_16553 [Aureobasidium sp. EXF-3400]|nr:hypothetical protein E4T51_15837 [Aureobasidium sp. EXF-12344]KAI4768358.1 hypothetical protein E4T52_16553 [Aureobasidium sp. EXF-3400]
MDIESSSVQQTPESGRPPKRVSQACEACRRKKSRCPGEKPACSLCTRLKQNCVYADDGSMPEVRSAAIERRMNARFSELENKLESLLKAMFVASCSFAESDTDLSKPWYAAYNLTSDTA